jgi:hypothetical protein
VQSRVFPGLRLDVPALLCFDLVALRAAVGHGVKDPAHAAFVQRLAAQ